MLGFYVQFLLTAVGRIQYDALFPRCGGKRHRGYELNWPSPPPPSTIHPSR